MVARNLVIFIIILVMFIILALIGYGIYAVQNRVSLFAKREKEADEEEEWLTAGGISLVDLNLGEIFAASFFTSTSRIWAGDLVLGANLAYSENIFGAWVNLGPVDHGQTIETTLWNVYIKLWGIVRTPILGSMDIYTPIMIQMNDFCLH
jgi:hypothetical protein